MEAPEERLFEGYSRQELRRRLRGFNTLVEVTRDLAAEIDLDTILSTIAEEACKALDCERASVFQYDEERGELFTRVTTELEIAEIRNSIDRGISGYVARSLKTANVPDPHADERWNSSVDVATGYTTRNLLAVPIFSPHGKQLLGVLELINKRKRPFDSFDEELVLAFSQHAAVALDRAGLVDQLKHRGQVEASLNIAREIQRAFMPNELPELPGYDFATWWFPNEAVGGDYCDVVPLPDGRTALIIADVSGHGLGPSLIMASVRAALRALLVDHNETDVLLSRLGRSMAVDLRDGRFITMVLAALDGKNHTLEFCNAGHSPALLYSPSQQKFSTLEATGLPLGVLDHPAFPRGSCISVAPGDLIVLCTDGIVEAMDQNREQFGLPRLKQIIAEHARAPLEELVRQIGAKVEQHYVGKAPPDDLTVLAARRDA